jgi:hypothetical protein
VNTLFLAVFTYGRGIAGRHSGWPGINPADSDPSAPPIRPDPTTLRPRPDSPAYFAIATPSPAPRPPSALRSRRLTTFQVQDAGSTPRARHRADADRVAIGWLVVHRWAPHRQDSSGLGFGMPRTSLPLVLAVDCISAGHLVLCRLASARESFCRGLGSGWFTERFHRNALVTDFQHGQVFCTARQLKDHAVTCCRLHQCARQR